MEAYLRGKATGVRVWFERNSPHRAHLQGVPYMLQLFGEVELFGFGNVGTENRNHPGCSELPVSTLQTRTSSTVT